MNISALHSVTLGVSCVLLGLWFLAAFSRSVRRETGMKQDGDTPFSSQLLALLGCAWQSFCLPKVSAPVCRPSHRAVSGLWAAEQLSAAHLITAPSLLVPFNFPSGAPVSVYPFFVPCVISKNP